MTGDDGDNINTANKNSGSTLQKNINYTKIQKVSKMMYFHLIMMMRKIGSLCCNAKLLFL